MQKLGDRSKQQEESTPWDDDFWDYSTTVLGGDIAELTDIMFIRV